MKKNEMHEFIQFVQRSETHTLLDDSWTIIRSINIDCSM